LWVPPCLQRAHSTGRGAADKTAALRLRGVNRPLRRTAARLADRYRLFATSARRLRIRSVLPRHSVEVRDVCRRLLWQTSGHAHQGDHQHPSAPASNKCHDQPPSRNHSCPHFPWSRKRQALLPRPGYADFRRLLTDPMAAGLFFSRSVGRRYIPIF